MQQRVGVGGVVAALSVTSDLTRGHPPGEAMRACLVAAELARLLRQSAGPEETGGEAACFAHLVCPECGAVTTEGHRPGCQESREQDGKTHG